MSRQIPFEERVFCKTGFILSPAQAAHLSNSHCLTADRGLARGADLMGAKIPEV